MSKDSGAIAAFGDFMSNEMEYTDANLCPTKAQLKDSVVWRYYVTIDNDSSYADNQLVKYEDINLVRRSRVVVSWNRVQYGTNTGTLFYSSTKFTGNNLTAWFEFSETKADPNMELWYDGGTTTDTTVTQNIILQFPEQRVWKTGYYYWSLSMSSIYVAYFQLTSTEVSQLNSGMDITKTLTISALNNS